MKKVNDTHGHAFGDDNFDWLLNALKMPLEARIW